MSAGTLYASFLRDPPAEGLAQPAAETEAELAP